ncbi:hypothetical protein Rhal01_01793 [Rubritalea halochordaticola]|uniref:Phosphodiester glycosidase domain-containing protein n=1 Tax=Rubritalea halochordaticola TaxID=714537 RepID=A0ABP9UYT5_9BACT
MDGVPKIFMTLFVALTCLSCTKADEANPKPKQSILPLAYHQVSSEGVTLHLISFDSRQYHLEVADQPKGPGSLWPDAKSCGTAKQALASINAGFFTPEGKPLGLVIENGTKRGYNNPSSLGSAFYYIDTNKKITAIARRKHLNNLTKNLTPTHLLQAGPMLSDGGHTVKGLSKQNARKRSFIAHDGADHWLIGYADACTLEQLSKAIAGKKLAGCQISNAMNLDGGRSSDLWISAAVPGGEQTFRSFFNKPVRNFLILKPTP